jgi:uncharacterized protein (DUF1697 family)
MKKVYVAFLRGINVGGKGKVSMAELKTCFEKLGFGAVKTYINSGNVVFVDGSNSENLANKIEIALSSTFKFPISVVVKSLPQMQTVVNGMPKSWHSNNAFRYYIMFLRPDVDKPSVIDGITVNPDMEEILYLPGAIFWSARISDIGRSRVKGFMGTKLYKEVTIRNLNTTLKMLELMKSAYFDNTI